MRSITTVLAVLSLLGTACGNEGPTDDAIGESPAASSETVGATSGDAAEVATDNGSDDGSASAADNGSVTIGDMTYGFDPTIQCSFFPGGVISIAGNATNDPDVEITFDAFEADDYLLSVVADGNEWISSAIDASVDDSSVSGTATTTDGAAETEASFVFSC